MLFIIYFSLLASSVSAAVTCPDTRDVLRDTWHVTRVEGGTRKRVPANISTYTHSSNLTGQKIMIKGLAQIVHFILVPASSWINHDTYVRISTINESFLTRVFSVSVIIAEVFYTFLLILLKRFKFVWLQNNCHNSFRIQSGCHITCRYFLAVIPDIVLRKYLNVFLGFRISLLIDDNIIQ